MSEGKEQKFKCPHCSSDYYYVIIPESINELLKNQQGPKVVISLYACKGCSIVFDDIEKFTEKTKLKEKNCICETKFARVNPQIKKIDA